MLITTTDGVEGHDSEILGIVFGNTVRAKHIGNDIMAGLKNIVGGELREYSKMLSEARAEALDRMTRRG